MNLEQAILTSTSGEYSRQIWYRSGPLDRPHPLCLFLDGEHYARDMGAVPLLEEWMQRGAMPHASLLFVSHVSSIAGGTYRDLMGRDLEADYHIRQHDYLCNDRYAAFIAEDVMRWARKRNACITPQGNIIGGLSLSGVASAYITLQHPKVFSSALCQSASYWALTGQEATWPVTKARFWLSVGDRETGNGVTHANGLHQTISQIDGVKTALERLRALGGTVHHHLYHGGHAMERWKAELSQALPWLLAP